MKKLLFVLPVAILLSAGCSASGVLSSPASVQAPMVQNTATIATSAPTSYISPFGDYSLVYPTGFNIATSTEVQAPTIGLVGEVQFIKVNNLKNGAMTQASLTISAAPATPSADGSQPWYASYPKAGLINKKQAYQTLDFNQPNTRVISKVVSDGTREFKIDETWELEPHQTSPGPDEIQDESANFSNMDQALDTLVFSIPKN